MIKIVKNFLRWILPIFLYEELRGVYLKIMSKQMYVNHKRALKKIRKKGKIKVAFFIYHESIWKFEELYKMMVKDVRFDPIVVICPYTTYGEETMLCHMNKAYKYFKDKEYNVVKTLDEKSGNWLNVKDEIQPDIVFFAVCWKITKSDYFITNYGEILSCYVPYTFVISYLNQAYFNGEMQNCVWKFFLETHIHKKLSQEYSQNKSVNTLVSGYPGMDKLLRKDYQPVDVWKIKDQRIKRIVWSPHHTIPDKGDHLDFSTFFKYYNFLFDVAEKYEGQIQIAFKPHPILRSKLSLKEVWGKEKTDKYYQKWSQLPNGQLNEGDYIDLFATSDGMINDSSAFVIEYLFTNKPQMFLVNDDRESDRFNEAGKTALSKLYLGKCEKDIDDFLKNIIIKGHDLMRNERILFFNSVVKPPNNVTASENIFNYLESEIFN